MTGQQGNTVGAYEAKTHLSELLEKVDKLVPIKREATTDERASAIKRIQKLASGLSLGRLKIKDLISEGRR